MATVPPPPGSNKHPNHHQTTPTPPTITTTNIVASGAAAANTTSPAPPSLQLLEPFGGGGGGGGDDDDDDDMRRNCSKEDMVLSDQGAGSRRPSTSSLSRFRSCPQLASVMNVSQDSPGCDMAPMTDADGNILHTSPVIQNNSNNNNNNSSNSNTLQVERPRYEMTSTPTPPSTPGARRKEMKVVSSYPANAQSNSNGASPCSTPKLSRRSIADQHSINTNNNNSNSLIPRTVSSESHVTDGAISSVRAFTSENLLKLDELSLKDSFSKRRSFYDDTSQDFEDRASDCDDDASSMHLCGRYSQQQHQFTLQHTAHHDLSNIGLGINDTHQQHQQHTNSNLLYPNNSSTDDSMDKCNRWLQGLKLSKSDKIKSRSHIQLPAL